MIYFLSDPHFGHSKDFIYGPRGFSNIYDHDNYIIEKWNETITPEDDVYILGDIMLNDNNYGLKCLKQLKGKIHIIIGNHDTNSRIELYKNCYNVVEVCPAKWLKAGGQMFFLSHCPCLSANHDECKPLKRRIINLCGHTHTSDKWADWGLGLIYHVEVDAHGCTPVSVEQVLEDIKMKGV